MKTTRPSPLHLVQSHDLPRGIQSVRALPDPELAALWDSIIVEDSVKERLLSQAVLNYTLRPKVERSVLPLHGVILLVGPPGTGKTSLARGLASTVASLLKGPAFRLVEVDPHALTSSAMGKTQRAVGELFSQSIAEQAASGPTIVLLDEVETLAADRTRMSLEANPVDIHRATDAVLVQLDALASTHPQLLFLATSNFPQAIDGAFTSRCDLVMEVPPPGAEASRQILRQCLVGVGETFPSIANLADSKDLESLARSTAGLDGRTLRKLVVNALAMRKETAMDPNKLTIADLLAAAKLAQHSRAASKGDRP
ncbi:AAA family ATPase [Polaromonas sp. JS666]|uniref:AAA family ATPase n=1 Tax=Polaromonas sp. (strain JS666 / ATCC BAA-500) TaxID=296591 RepID=UPI0000534D37|nr:AAA family ATPase [Polaromonas sp. JS666]ABE47025.1 AAA ATPase, central region [Polaromonas sp. JS666]